MTIRCCSFPHCLSGQSGGYGPTTAFAGCSYKKPGEVFPGHGSWQCMPNPQTEVPYPADYHGIYHDRLNMAPFPVKDPRAAPY